MTQQYTVEFVNLDISGYVEIISYCFDVGAAVLSNPIFLCTSPTASVTMLSKPSMQYQEKLQIIIVTRYCFPTCYVWVMSVYKRK